MPTPNRAAAVPPAVVRAHDVHARAAAPIPKVVRRLVAEEEDLVERSRAMATELPDPRGRARALADVSELAEELAAIAATMERSSIANGGVASDILDDVVGKLLLLDTRLALLHERLRTATERTTAVLVE